MHLLSHDYFSDKADPSVGLSRVASLIRQARAERQGQAGATLLLDNGDSLQGTPLGELGDMATGRAHPFVTALQTLGYDAIGLGNHDFNYGIPALAAAVKDAPCPILCSNMRALHTDLDLPFVQSAVLRKALSSDGQAPELRIGLLSVLPPQTLLWDSHHLADKVAVDDMTETVARQAVELKRSGCDIVVLLGHTGIGTGGGRTSENALRTLADIAEVDAVIGGHTHLHLPHPDEPFDKPVVMPGAFGSHLGVIDLHLQQSDAGWTVTHWHNELRAIAERDADGNLLSLVDEDKELVSALAADHQATCTRMQRAVGETPQSLHSYFTLFAQDRALALVASAQAAAVRPLLAGTTLADLPLLSAVAPGKFGGRSGPGFYTDVAAGPICLRHVADLHPFPNQLCAVLVTGQQVADWLEMAAGQFNRVDIGETGAPLMDSSRAGHNFDVLFGLTYAIDLSVPARFRIDGTLADANSRRIRNLSLNGHAIADDQPFVVVVNSYRAGGGGNFPHLDTAERLPLPRLSIRDILRDYLGGHLPLDPLEQAPTPWQFLPMPNTTVTVLTGPGARPYLPELAPRNVKVGRITSEGFLRLDLQV